MTDITALAARIGKIEQSSELPSTARWGVSALTAGLATVPPVVAEFFAMQTDEDITRILFTRRSDVTLSAAESDAADELTIAMLSVEF